MGVEQNANYKVWNGTDLDIVHFTTKAELVSIKDTNNKFTATDTEGALLELKTEQATHLADNMPHQFKNLEENKTYRFGFQVSADGKPQIIYEEVL